VQITFHRPVRHDARWGQKAVPDTATVAKAVAIAMGRAGRCRPSRRCRRTRRPPRGDLHATGLTWSGSMWRCRTAPCWR